MTDSLRIRIAKALYGQILHPVPLFDSQPDDVQAAWLADADAVIDLLIDMAGHGELLKAIDRMHRE